jgi:hypothetical protein
MRKLLLIITAVLVLGLGIMSCTKTPSPYTNPYQPAPESPSSILPKPNLPPHFAPITPAPITPSLPKPPTLPSPNLPTPLPKDYSIYNLYLSQTEWYQQRANNDLNQANAALHSASEELAQKQFGRAELYNYYMQTYQRYMESYADNQKMANEYLIKAQRELAK